jgi:DNA mismatch repair protein MSH6
MFMGRTLQEQRNHDHDQQRRPDVVSTEPVLLDVSFADKDAAKSLGARYKADAKRWFVPPGLALGPFTAWIHPDAMAKEERRMRQQKLIRKDRLKRQQNQQQQQQNSKSNGAAAALRNSFLSSKPQSNNNSRQSQENHHGGMFGLFDKSVKSSLKKRLNPSLETPEIMKPSQPSPTTLDGSPRSFKRQRQQQHHHQVSPSAAPVSSEGMASRPSRPFSTKKNERDGTIITTNIATAANTTAAATDGRNRFLTHAAATTATTSQAVAKGTPTTMSRPRALQPILKDMPTCTFAAFKTFPGLRKVTGGCGLQTQVGADKVEIRDGHKRTPDKVDYDGRTLTLPHMVQARLSDTMKQYWTTKSRHFDKIVLMQVGAFFEVYDDDAHVLHQELKMAFTGTAAKHKKVGQHGGKLEDFIYQLVSRGYSVAVVREMVARTAGGGAAAATKRGSGSAVERRCTEVVTPATAMPSPELNPSGDVRSLLCICDAAVEVEGAGKHRTRIGICEFNTQRSVIKVGWFDDDARRTQLRSFLALCNPCEVIVPCGGGGASGGGGEPGPGGGATKRTLKLLRRMASSQVFSLDHGHGGFVLHQRPAFADHESICRSLRRAQRLPHLGGAQMAWPCKCKMRSDKSEGRPFAWLAVCRTCWHQPSFTPALGACLERLEECMFTDSQIKSVATSMHALGKTAPKYQQVLLPEKEVLANMRIDHASAQNLELLATADGSSEGSLLGLVSHCVTAAGTRFLRAAVLQPSANQGVIVDRQNAVVDLTGLTFEAEVKALRELLGHPLVKHLAANVAKCHRLAHKGAAAAAVGGGGRTFMTPKAIGNNGKGGGIQRILGPVVGVVRACEMICRTVEACATLQENSDSRRIHRLLLEAPAMAAATRDGAVGGGVDVGSHEYRSVVSFDGLLPPLRKRMAEVEAFFDARAVDAALRGGGSGGNGEVDDVAICEEIGRGDMAFQATVGELQSGKDALAAFLRDTCADPWCKNPRGVTTSAVKNEAVLEIPTKILDESRLPKSFVLVKTFKTKRMYRVKGLQAIVDAQAALVDKMERARSDVIATVIKRIDDLLHDSCQRAIHCLAELDFLLALATAAERMEGRGEICYPTILPPPPSHDRVGGPVFRAVGARHPSVEKKLQDTNQVFQPNDVLAGREHPAFLMLTGPNMGGKSTTLRMVATLIVLAQLGCPVPARSLEMTVFDQIFCRMGGKDNLLEGLSTFQVELEETSNAMNHATENSLVLLDELGRGTATHDGCAIAHAVSRHFSKLGCVCFFSTHYHALVEDFLQDPRFAFFHMHCLVGKDESDVTRTFQLVDGPSDKSHGISVAAAANIPAPIIRRAIEAANAFELVGQGRGGRKVHAAVRGETENEKRVRGLQAILRAVGVGGDVGVDVHCSSAGVAHAAQATIKDIWMELVM